MEFQNIIELIKTVSNSNLAEFQMEENDVKIKIKTDKSQKVVMPPMPPQMMAPSMVPSAVQAPVAVVPPVSGSVEVTQESEGTVEKVLSGNIVKSPLVGTFYSSPSPDEDVYVQVGDQVKKGQTLGIVEAMKLMNEIECEFDGVVQEILVNNEDRVEYGQPLFVIG